MRSSTLVDCGALTKKSLAALQKKVQDRNARAAGLHKMVRVIENGSDAPGTVLGETSADFKKAFKKAGLVLAKGQGDCEDYAIAKFASLRAAGVARERLRLVYVRARLPGQTEDQPHMVLAYHAEPGAEPLVLDNLRPEILPAGQRPDLTPVFSFNDEGLWQGTGSTRAGNPLARVSRWREVWGRTLDEGFR